MAYSDDLDLRITDSSLRDGSHAQLHRFSVDDVVAIVGALDDAGVPVRLTRRELQHSYGADPADLELVADTLSGLGLEVTGRDAGSRRID